MNRQPLAVRSGLGVGYGTKRAARDALAALRAEGRNHERDIDIMPARTPLARLWVVARQDHHNGTTDLMRHDGTWLRGRLHDATPCFHATPCRDPHPAPWTRLAGDPQPATFAHVTRTVPDAANQRERFRTKSNGSCGRWVRTDESVALCTCGWKSYAATRDEARGAARAHRANPAPPQ